MIVTTIWTESLSYSNFIQIQYLQRTNSTYSSPKSLKGLNVTIKKIQHIYHQNHLRIECDNWKNMETV